MDEATLAKTGLRATPGGWTGGTLPPGATFPKEPRRFHFDVEADGSEQAIARVRAAVDEAGGLCDGYTAEPARD